MNSRLLATYLDRWDMQPFRDGAVYSYAGNFDAGARPRWRASGHLDWRYGPWMASYAVEYIGTYTEIVSPLPEEFGFPFDPYRRQVESALYHDIDARFEFDTGVTLRAAITNITDEDPPYVNIPPANTDPATYRLLGRSYFWSCVTKLNSTLVAGTPAMSVAARARRTRAPLFIDPPGYARHRPERTLLYQLVGQHSPAFCNLRAEAGRPLPD